MGVKSYFINSSTSVDQKQTLDDTDVNRKQIKIYKVVKQVILVTVWICLGLCLEITGPTLTDLMARLQVNYEEIARALTCKSVGVFAGSIIGGFIHERFCHQSEVMVAVAVWCIAVATASIPWARSLELMGFFLAVDGAAEGFINTGGNVMVMDLWGDQAASPMQSLHFGFGFGAILVPQLVRPFLSPDSNEDNTTFAQNTTSPSGISVPTDSAVSPIVPTIWETSRIEYPYFIVGVAALLIGICMLLLHLKGPPKGLQRREPQKSMLKYFNPNTCAPGNGGFSIGILACLFLYFIQAAGGERAIGKFIFSYATNSNNKFSKGDGTTLNSVFWLSFTIGRGAGVIIAKFVPTQAMIVMEICGCLVSSIVLSIFGWDNSTIIWVFVPLMGFFVARLFPGGMSWANIYLEINSMAVMILVIGASCGGFIYQYGSGLLFQTYGEYTLMYILVVCFSILAVVYTIMQPVASCFGGKTLEDTDVEDKVVSVSTSRF